MDTLKNIIIYLSVLLLILLVRLSPVYAGFEEGYAASERGDYETAFKEFKPLAEQGDARAQHILGVMYYYSQGIPKDYAEAFKWYKKAAEQGYAESQHILGGLYEVGLGVPKDYAEAFKWYKKAAEQGYAESQNNLGFMYDNGNGVTKDYAEAFKWYKKAAEQGNAGAQNNLGFMYHKGHGVPKDYVMAYMWFNLAATQGVERAITFRSTLKKEMTPEQIVEAQRLFREFKVKENLEDGVNDLTGKLALKHEVIKASKDKEQKLRNNLKEKGQELQETMSVKEAEYQEALKIKGDKLSDVEDYRDKDFKRLKIGKKGDKATPKAKDKEIERILGREKENKLRSEPETSKELLKGSVEELTKLLTSKDETKKDGGIVTKRIRYQDRLGNWYWKDVTVSSPISDETFD